MSANTELRRQSLANHEIADPGASGAIPVRRSGIVSLISATTETRTIAVPAKSGIELQLVGKTVVGAITITVASAFSEYGDTQIVISAAGQFALLRSYEVAAGTYAWRVISAEPTLGLIADMYTSATGTTRVGVPLTAISKEDGTQMIKQATTVTGFAQLANKNLVIHIPANSTAEAFAFTVDLPTEMGRDMLSADAGVYIDVVVSKGGALDTLTLDCEGYVLDPDTGAPTWGADRYAGAAQTITQAAVTLSFELTGIASNATTLPQAIAGVLTLGGTNDGDVVYIHSVSVRAPKSLLVA